ncbi:granzyme H-like isoform X2 [Cavia porcellus]|uniref:granzyme H-like isoform X2 n=1 Tax=Cavia porcellus TaxID=10141 RepID=UPI002FDFF264
MTPLLLLLSLLLPLEAGTEIIGGHEAKPHSYPYMAFVQQLIGDDKYRCGGVLVRKKFVLTAAHCNGSSINVILGAHNIKKQEKTQQVIRVKRAIPHPDHVPGSFSNDIMLLELERKAKQTKAVQPLRLHEAMSQVNPGDTCLVAGWGKRTPSDDLMSTTLQEVELTVQDEQECKSAFHAYSALTEICVGDPKEMKISSEGDSGTPLVCNNMIQGILSNGAKDDTPPVVFMKVSHFLPWIKKTMGHF